MKILIKRCLRSFLMAFVFCLPAAANAQDAGVKASIDTRQITIGDPVRLFLEASHAPGRDRLEWTAIPDSFNHLEVLEKGKIDTLHNGGTTTYRQKVLITGFDSGRFTIPAFAFSVIPADGSPYLIHTDSFQLDVSTVAVDTSQPFKAIKGIMEVQSSWRDYIWWIIGGLVLAGLLAFTIWYFRKNRKTPIPARQPAAPPETPQQKALRLLGELEKKQLWQTGRIKDYYSELTDILREYIEGRFRMPAMELTTDEFMQNVERHRELSRFQELLAGVLSTADLAKFAKAKPLPAEHISALENTRQFIVNTKPVIQNTPDQT